MKKVYISCYENDDSRYKDKLIEINSDRNQTLFFNMPSDEKLLQIFAKKLNNDHFIENIKKNALKNTDVVIFLVGLETNKRMFVDWEVRAAMTETDLLKKCGIVVVYLPELFEKYGTKIPRSVLPKILQINMNNPNAFIYETSWHKIMQDVYNIEQILNIGFAYGQMSKYYLDNNYLKTNIKNIYLDR